MGDSKPLARQIFAHALAESSVAAALGRQVEYHKGALRIGEDLHDLSSFAKTAVISFGKAAPTMAEALTAEVGGLAGGIIAAPEAALAGKPQLPNYRYFAAGHPLPNAESVRAADAVLKVLAALPENALVIYLISGGGSSLLEKPIDDEIALEDLISTYAALVHSGAPIAEVNTIRKHLSAVKGGRLAKAAARQGAQQVSVMVSDVPDNALDALASGPTMPDSTTAESCYAIAAKHSLLERLPASVRDLFEKRALEETPKKDDPVFQRSRWWTVLSNATALKAAAEAAANLGYAVEIDNSCDDQDYARAADHLLNKLRKLRSGTSRSCLLSGGEVTVKVGGTAGKGGRNQQFALYCAQKIAAEDITVLSAGTDGIDGNSDAAGAVVDGATLARYSKLGQGRSLSQAEKAFDAAPVFAALGDAIVTGPTGTNVRDVRILLAG